MAEQVSIELFGDELFRRKIRKMAYRALDMRPVLESLGEDMQDHIEHQFETEGRASGRPWAPLTIETAARRGSAHPILIRTSELLLEMTNPDSIKVTHDSVTIDIPQSVEMKGESAQFGFTSRAGRPVAPRRMVDFSVLDRWAFGEKITDFLVNGRVGKLEEYFTP